MPRPLQSLLTRLLHTVERRYRLPDWRAQNLPVGASPATLLALTIERTGQAPGHGAIDPALRRQFIDALATLIQDALRGDSGDPVFQAMVLRHRQPQVREFASLCAQQDQDRRTVRAGVNSAAHPEKRRRLAPPSLRPALANIESLASSASWAELRVAIDHALRLPPMEHHPSIASKLTKLLDSPALIRLQRIAVLKTDPAVREYQALWERHGPPSGSKQAKTHGANSRHRGAEVEALAARTLAALADRLNRTECPNTYRVITSMKVPAAILRGQERAKNEWDAVLLRRTASASTSCAWHVCLLVEAKASLDAATTDLPKLMRGLRLLAHADPDEVYSFQARQGWVDLRGASLKALGDEQTALQDTVLYCCDAPVEVAPRLLSASSRMQLLSAQASLQFAVALQENRAELQLLEPLWDEVLHTPAWRNVLYQYNTLRQVRDLMVHPNDLLEAINDLPAD